MVIQEIVYGRNLIDLLLRIKRAEEKLEVGKTPIFNMPKVNWGRRQELEDGPNLEYRDETRTVLLKAAVLAREILSEILSDDFLPSGPALDTVD